MNTLEKISRAKQLTEQISDRMTFEDNSKQNATYRGVRGGEGRGNECQRKRIQKDRFFIGFVCNIYFKGDV